MNICKTHKKELKQQLTCGFGIESEQGKQECPLCRAERIQKQIEKINRSAPSK
jgi:hypothetical protein